MPTIQEKITTQQGNADVPELTALFLAKEERLLGIAGMASNGNEPIGFALLTADVNNLLKQLIKVK